jgi:hypothetical protein
LWRGVGASVVLGLAIVVATCGCFGATSARPEKPNLRGIYIIYTYCFLQFGPVFSIVMGYLGAGNPSS